jgi:hypothetical protein
MKEFYTFLLNLYKTLKGSIFANLSRICLIGGIALLGVTPWWDEIIKSFIEKEFDIKINQNPNTTYGGLLILSSFIFAYIEYKAIQKKAISEALAKTTEENAFLTFQSQQEDSCYSVLRALVNKFQKLGTPLLAEKANEINLSHDKVKLVEYIEFILFNKDVNDTQRIWFYNTLAEGQTGQPLLYQFVENYEKIIQKATELNCENQIARSPLNNAYRNVTDPEFLKIRKAAYWERYV